MINFNIKNRLRSAVLSIFDKGNNPMANTLQYSGDPGLFGPDSITWQIISDVSGFMAGVRALMIQSAHPEVADGFIQHSTINQDPLGRISRTGDYVAVTTFGAMPEVNNMINMIQKMHERVVGTSSRGIHYSANQPELSAWVHYALVQSFLTAYHFYGDQPLSTTDADQFVQEQTKLGKLLHVTPLINTENELHQWIASHPELEQTPSTISIMNFLTHPPINFATKMGYRWLFDAATNSIPKNIQKILTIKQTQLGHVKGTIFTRLLRTSMGYSPALKSAYDRIKKPYPKRYWFIE